MQEVILFYKGLGIPIRQILDLRDAIPSKTAADAKIAIQEMVEYSQKSQYETSMSGSTKTSDGLATIQAQLNNLGRDIKTVNKKVYAAQVTTLGREVANGRPWTKVKQMMTDEFHPTEEVQRLKDELRHLKLRDMNIAAYTKRRMGHKAKDCRSKNVASGAIVQSNVVCYECGERGYKNRACSKKTNRRGENVQGQAYVIRDAEHNQGPNVVTGRFLLNNRYPTMLFDSGADKSFVDIKFIHLIDIKPVKLNSNYEVELADEKVVSTNSVLKGCTLNLLDHLFDIDLMPIELGTFDIIVGIDLLVEHDALIVCCKKEVHVPYKNKTLVVKSDSSVSRLKVISCIKARKYIERGSQLFIAQVAEKEPAKKQLQDMPMICNLPEVFPDDLTRLPPPRQVEFKIELIPGNAPVACAPYRLAPSKLKELSDQLKELSDKGFIRSSSSPWGAPFMIVFIDDILISSKNKEDHEKHLKIILELLKNEKLYAKFSKCDFWLKSVQLLGHLIDSNGVYVDHEKVEAIPNWSAPTTPMEKNKKYEWGMEEEEAFQTLNQKLCSTPILALPEGTKNFIVYCDASLKGFGAVLMQSEKKELNMRQTRGIELLSKYDCKIRYHPGKGNIVANALSQKDRKPLRVRSLVMTVHTNLPEKILEAQTKAMKEENVKAENVERKCLRFDMNAHLVYVDVSTILCMRTLSLYGWVHIPYEHYGEFPFQEEGIFRLHYCKSSTPLPNFLNMNSLISSASSFLGVSITLSLRHNSSVFLVMKSGYVSRTICSMGLFHDLRRNSSGISIQDAKQLMEAIEKRFGGNAATKKDTEESLKTTI
nr:reverse transcriptase domain-containing protein [Tanacetum cinerariifolium]